MPSLTSNAKRTALALAVFSIAFIAPRFALAEGTFYYITGFCFPGGTSCTGSDTLGADDYPGKVSVLPFIQQAEADCSVAGYAECNFESWYISGCADSPGGCTWYDTLQYSKTYTGAPVAIGNYKDHNWYALVKVSDTLTASPTTITAGGSAALTWTSQFVNNNCSIDNGVGNVTPVIGGSVRVAPASTTTYTLTCTGSTRDGSNDTGTAIAHATVTVPGGSQPDLTAGPVTPTNAAPGVAATFSATITDSGSATGAGFTNLFQLASDAAGDDAQNVGTVPMAALSVGSAPTALSYTFAAPGTYYMRACADLPPQPSGVISESNENNNCGAWTAIVVGSSGPDLVASPVWPRTASGNTPQTYTATITNSGSQSTGSGFDNLLQEAGGVGCDTDIDNCTGITDVASAPMNAIAAGNNRIASFQYTAPPGGTIYLRVCADKSSATDPGQITESNENNNCGEWTPIVVAAPAVSCSVSPANGDTSTLFTWTAVATGGKAPYTYVWHGIDLDGQTRNPASVTYSDPDTYFGSVDVHDASGADLGTVSCDNTATVVQTGPRVSCTITTPAKCNGASSCTLAPDQKVVYQATPIDGATGPYQWTSSAPTLCGTGTDSSQTCTYGSSTYSMSVIGLLPSGGPTLAAACPLVISGGGPACTGPDSGMNFSANPDRVAKGKTTMLTYSISNTSAKQCTISGPGYYQAITPVACAIPSASIPTNPITSQELFTFTCNSSKTAIVNLLPGFFEF